MVLNLTTTQSVFLKPQEFKKVNILVKEEVCCWENCGQSFSDHSKFTEHLKICGMEEGLQFS